MTIPASSIVNVIPNVLDAGGNALDLNALMLTNSDRIPIGTVSEFSDAASVADYFGSGSDEASLATIYFNGFEGRTATPGALLMAQYNESAVGAWLRGGDVSGLTLAQLQAITGTLAVVIDGYSYPAAALDLSASTSFSSGATIIETALNGAKPTQAEVTGAISTTTLTVSAVTSGTLKVGQVLSGSGVTAGTTITAFGTGTGGTGTYTVSESQTAGSTTITAVGGDISVSYDSTSGAYLIESALTGVLSTSAYATGTTAAALKLTSATGAVTSQGAAAAAPGTFMDDIVELTQNWVSFMTTFDPDNSGFDNKEAFAEWNNDQDDRWAYICWDTDSSPTTQNPATGCLGYAIDQANISGTSLWYSPDAELAAMVCGTIASIDTAQPNGRITIAFKSQSGISSTADTSTEATNLIANGYNYYGAYATANEDFTFCYPGSISGDFAWLDSYVNQIWMNNSFQQSLMSLLTNVNSIPYNSAGYAMIEQSCMDTINAALNFGAIRAGVPLSSTQAASANAAAGEVISGVLETRGWYLQVLPASAEVRAARQSPTINFWYMDGQAVQHIELTSTNVQ